MTQNERYPDSKNTDSIQQGLEFQDFVMDELARVGILLQNYSSAKYQLTKGENRQGFEIKLDNICTRSRRLSIEIAERTAENRDWVPSGIYARNGNNEHSLFYIQGNFDRFWLFTTSFLQQLERAKNNGDERYEHKEEKTVRAFYLPEEDATKYGVLIEPQNN